MTRRKKYFIVRFKNHCDKDSWSQILTTYKDDLTDEMIDDFVKNSLNKKDVMYWKNEAMFVTDIEEVELPTHV